MSSDSDHKKKGKKRIIKKLKPRRIGTVNDDPRKSTKGRKK